MYTTETMASCMQPSPTLAPGGMGSLTMGEPGPLLPSPHHGLHVSCSVAAAMSRKTLTDQQHFTSNNNYHQHCVQDMEFDESFDEEVDEEFSDDEDPECDMDQDDQDNATSSTDDASAQLLKFADMLNGDIQKYFGAKKGDEESCNIYEDKWKHSRSGRELYYADLMKIAQGLDTDAEDKVTSSTTESSDPAPTGKMDKKVGLGPLGELFEYGLKDYWNDKKVATKLRKLKKFKSDDPSRFEEQVPLNKRQFPNSFWSEPCYSHSAETGTKDSQTCSKTSNNNTILTSSKTPDFSDLLESWTGDDHGDMSSSDLATPSPTASVQHVPTPH